MDTWPNGVPRISDKQRQTNLQDVQVLHDLISYLYLYIGHHTETKLTTEQKELLYDIVEASRAEDRLPGEPPMNRWWRGEQE